MTNNKKQTRNYVTKSITKRSPKDQTDILTSHVKQF